MGYDTGVSYTQQQNATPGSSANQPASGKKKYGLDVTVGYEGGGIGGDPRVRHTGATRNEFQPRMPVTRDLGDVLQAVYRMPKDQVKRLQDRLVGAGLLSRKAITYGVADEDTVAAYEKLLLRASYGHKTPDEALDEAIAAGAPSLDGGGRERAPFSPTVSSPEEIRAALDQAVPAIIGHALSDAESTQLVSLYQSLQVRAQRQAYDTAESGGTSTSVVPFDVFAEQQAKRLHPDDAQTRGLANLAKAFLSGIQGETTADRVF